MIALWVHPGMDIPGQAYLVVYSLLLAKKAVRRVACKLVSDFEREVGE